MNSMGQRLLLTNKFKQRVNDTGMTREALARVIGVSCSFFNELLSGDATPTATFMAGAIRAGLGKEFTDIAMWQLDGVSEEPLKATTADEEARHVWS